MYRSCTGVRTWFSVLAVSLLTVTALAQSSENAPATQQAPSVSSTPSQTPPNTRIRRTRHTACWREAGIPAEKINQQWKIEDAGKVKISGVCSDPKLTAEQRLGKIHEINEETEREIANVIPPKQLAAYRSCQGEQAKTTKKARGPAEKELGPCGGIIPPDSKGHEAHDHSAMSHPSN
jgi:hypothetical protein